MAARLIGDSSQSLPRSATRVGLRVKTLYYRTIIRKIKMSTNCTETPISDFMKIRSSGKSSSAV